MSRVETRPLCKRASKLTPAEQETFEDVVSNTLDVFHALHQQLYEARYGPLARVDLAPARANGRPNA